MEPARDWRTITGGSFVPLGGTPLASEDLVPCDDQPQACKDARQDYDLAENEMAAIHTAIANAQDVRSGGGALFGAGAIVLAGVVVVSGPIGWLGAAAIGAVVVGGGGALLGQYDVRQLRADCERARQKMYKAYQSALESCTNDDCIPPRSWTEPCP